jgi:hypothetical protein
VRLVTPAKANAGKRIGWNCWPFAEFATALGLVLFGLAMPEIKDINKKPAARPALRPAAR